MLQEFFAVSFATNAILYAVKAGGENGHPCICKIESWPKPRRKKRKDLEIAVMTGRLLAVAKWLQLFYPTHLRKGRQEQHLHKTNTLQWMGGTPLIVALFLTEEKARECLASSNLKPCDSRWKKDTKEVLAAIGENHPTFVVCRGRWKHWRHRALIY